MVDLLFWIIGGVLKIGWGLIAICLVGYAISAVFFWVFNIV